MVALLRVLVLAVVVRVGMAAMVEPVVMVVEVVVRLDLAQFRLVVLAVKALSLFKPMAELRLFVQQVHRTHCRGVQLHSKYGLLAQGVVVLALLQAIALLAVLEALVVFHIIHFNKHMVYKLKLN
jgi:hypothetical protein